ncbi:MAG TPA: methyltransferase domain-containing protein [Candidatus Paceibacterota bacterium]
MWFALPLQIQKMILNPQFRGYRIVEFGVFSSYGHPPLIEEALKTGDLYLGVTHSKDQHAKLSKAYAEYSNITILYMATPVIFSTQLPDESADLVIFSNSFHEFIHEKSLLTEVHRILKHGATLAIAEFSQLQQERMIHFANHDVVSKYTRTVIPLEPSLGVSVELYQKNNFRFAPIQ